MAQVITRTDMGSPQYFSLEVGRDFGAPLGGWTPDRNKALQFFRERDARAFVDQFLAHAAALCSVGAL